MRAGGAGGRGTDAQFLRFVFFLALCFFSSSYLYKGENVQVYCLREVEVYLVCFYRNVKIIRYLSKVFSTFISFPSISFTKYPVFIVYIFSNDLFLLAFLPVIFFNILYPYCIMVVVSILFHLAIIIFVISFLSSSPPQSSSSIRYKRGTWVCYRAASEDSFGVRVWERNKLAFYSCLYSLSLHPSLYLFASLSR